MERNLFKASNYYSQGFELSPAALSAALGGKQVGHSWECPCPCCGKKATISKGDRVASVIKCWHDCEQSDVIKALQEKGLHPKRVRNDQSVPDDFVEEEDEDLPEDIEEISKPREIDGSYDYLTSGRRLMYQCIQYKNPKSFGFRQPDGHGQWIWNIRDLAPLPYLLPNLITAKPDDPIFVVEGEKDADSLGKRELIATTSHGGAGQCDKIWPRIAHYLKDRRVVILPDQHDGGAGETYAEAVRSALDGVAASIKRVNVPIPKDGWQGKWDVSDWLEQGGGTASQLLQMADAASEWIVESATARAQSWPVLHEAAYHGLAGQTVKAIAPHTEADPVAMLIQYLTMFGNIVGRANAVILDGKLHFPNLGVVIVGNTAKARKGTALARVRALFENGSDWTKRIKSGLSSGEGLISALRDRVTKDIYDKETGKVIGTEVVDEGVADKRLLTMEEEYARMSIVMERPGNTLSPIIRDLLDGNDLGIMTKQPMTATAPHGSIIGHCTIDELQRVVTVVDAANGYANRFLFALARRSQELPDGGSPDPDVMRTLQEKLERRVREVGQRSPTQKPRIMVVDDTARPLWHQIYHVVTKARYGLVGAIVARGEAHIMRLALIYALLDGGEKIGEVHLEAAFELWCYCEDSAEYIFGDSTGDPLADRILEALKEHVEGMTRTDIRELFHRNQSSDRIERALEQLRKQRKASMKMEPTGRRSRERWVAN